MPINPSPFPRRAIYQINQVRDERRPVEMTVAFMGLTGPQGVLPRYYTELMLERLQLKDQTLRDFFDLFNHRMISLFFRAWEKHHCTVGFEQWLLKGSEDRFAGCLFALAGHFVKFRQKIGYPYRVAAFRVVLGEVRTVCDVL